TIISAPAGARHERAELAAAGGRDEQLSAFGQRVRPADDIVGRRGGVGLARGGRGSPLLIPRTKRPARTPEQPRPSAPPARRTWQSVRGTSAANTVVASLVFGDPRLEPECCALR